MTRATVGVIGGSGLYDIESLVGREEVSVETPFGPPSDAITIGTLGGRRAAFLPRHGRGHRVSPAEIPARANIFALKTLGVTHIVSVSAVGSLREEMRPLDMVVPDQIIDRTKGRAGSFFGGGIVAHVAFADPFCPGLSAALHRAAAGAGPRAHMGGTLIAMEGPLFSTRAEAELYRSWGASIIGMTALPEAKLAREAEICYATLACVTDFDCWHPDHDSVSVELVVSNLLANVAAAQEVVARVMASIPDRDGCACPNALESAIITAPDAIPERVASELAPLVGRYLSARR